MSTSPPKPLSKEALIQLIDENYNDIMAGVGFSFVGAGGNGSDMMNQLFLEQFGSKPVLQHVLKKHIENGANFVAAGNLSALALQVRDITMPDQINAALLGQAIKAANFQGDLLNAWEYVSTGLSGPG